MQIFSIFKFILSVCFDGWRWNPDFSKCYYYLNENVQRTWNETNEKCAALDPEGVATLTSVRSREEHNYIRSMIDTWVWIGGTDEAEEATWRWVKLNRRA